MKLGLRFLLFLLFFVCLSFSIHMSSELMGHAVERHPYQVEQEIDYVDELLVCKKEERLNNLLERYEKYYRFNGSILVSWKGRVICNTTMGVSDFKTKEPLTAETPFQLASVSKQFTSMAIMLLHENGKLDFDDEVKLYIPQWPYPGMTIRQLLNHSSGLPNYMWLLEHQWSSKRAPYNHEVVGMLIKHKMPLNYIPGRYHSYSNTGYVVLAYLVERISGKYFADYLHENIFEPLGMKNTFAYSQSIDRRNKEKVSGYQRNRKGFKLIEETIHDGCIGDKGIYSTAEDLYRWDQALYSGRLVSPEVLEEAFSMSELRNKRKFAYGFGFRINEQEESKTIYHHGLWNGFRTSFMRYVNDSSAIIVLNNTNSDAKHILVKDIEKILLSEEEIPADELAKATAFNNRDSEE